MTRKNRLFPEPDELECGCVIGGGRESGGDSHRAGSITASSERPAAANSAAHSQRWEAFLCQCVCKEDHERIRELEAELERRTTGLQRTAGDNLHAYERECARAEKAEARVKEADAVIAKLSEGGVNWIDGAYRGFHLQKALHARESRIPLELQE